MDSMPAAKTTGWTLARLISSTVVHSSARLPFLFHILLPPSLLLPPPSSVLSPLLYQAGPCVYSILPHLSPPSMSIPPPFTLHLPPAASMPPSPAHHSSPVTTATETRLGPFFFTFRPTPASPAVTVPGILIPLQWPPSTASSPAPFDPGLHPSGASFVFTEFEAAPHPAVRVAAAASDTSVAAGTGAGQLLGVPTPGPTPMATWGIAKAGEHHTAFPRAPPCACTVHCRTGKHDDDTVRPRDRSRAKETVEVDGNATPMAKVPSPLARRRPSLPLAWMGQPEGTTPKASRRDTSTSEATPMNKTLQQLGKQDSARPQSAASQRSQR